MGRLFHLTVFFILVGFQTPYLLYGAWQGPQTIFTGPFGKEPGQFFFVSKETADFFPRNFGVDATGNVLINDNGRVQIFNAKGELVKIVTKPDEVKARPAGWPSEILVHPKGGFLADSGNQETSFFDSEYKYIKSIKSYGDIYAIGDGYIFDNYEDGYEHYDLNGNLINKYVELPKNYEKKVVSSDFNTKFNTIYIDEKIFRIPEQIYISNYFVSNDSEYIYIYGRGVVTRLDLCGQQLGHWELPAWTVFHSEPSASSEPYEFVHTEYGDPMVDGNGNIYTYEKTPNHYSILKWTWVDSPDDPKPGPDAPTNLKVTPSLDGLYLTWEASPQDPGCVDGYELERATSAGGVYTNVTTTDPGVLKFNDSGALSGTTYFYKVRAKGGGEYSPYTTEVSGKRIQ